MGKRQAEVVKVSTPGDVVCSVTSMLGFTPTESVVVICVHGPRRRMGLIVRFDLEDVTDAAEFAAMLSGRIELEDPDGFFVLVYTDGAAEQDYRPGDELVAQLIETCGVEVMDAYLVSDGRWWSYLCSGPCCGQDGGTPIDATSPGATALAAAYAIRGHGILPDRSAVARSVALELDGAAQMVARDLIVRRLRHYRDQPRLARQLAIRRLTDALLADRDDPRSRVSDAAVADFAALADDVVVRDEILVRSDSPEHRDELLPLLSELARRTPPPFDPPVCAMLAWVAYADGNGVIANIAVERALTTDSRYSLAQLIQDSLYRQIPPQLLEEVMKGAARDLRRRA